jgi:hypothetical protein
MKTAGYYLIALLLTNLFDMFQQVSRIYSLSTPSISFSSSSFGYTIIKTKWSVEIDFEAENLTNLDCQLIFPFAVATPIEVRWTPITSQCDKIRSTTSVTSSVIVGDEVGSHYFTMVNANFKKTAQYYMEIKLFNFPASGFRGPVRFFIVSTKNSKDNIKYAYNSNFVNLFFFPAPTASLTVSTAASSTVPFNGIITRTFPALIDVTVTSAKPASRLFFKLNQQKYSYDSAQTCETIDAGVGFKYYAPGTYQCYFEDEEELKGLYFVLNTGEFVSGDKIRFQLKIKNPNVPGTSSMAVALMKRYDSEILEYVNSAGAFTCLPSTFKTSYPKLYLGPSLDTSSANFPNLNLYRSQQTSNTIVFNSIRLDFFVDYDIPTPSTFYNVKIKINGSAKTTIPPNYIYENLVLAPGKTRKVITVNPATKDIMISNVGEFSAIAVYSIGFKIILEGDEALSWAGANSFCSITIEDSAGNIIIAQTSPVGVNPSVQTVVAQVSPSGNNLPTVFHSLDKTAPFSDLQFITLANYGLKKGTDNFFFLRSTSGTGIAPVALNSYIEVITSKSLTGRTSTAWTDANALTNCVTLDNPALATFNDNGATMQSCYFEQKNKGSPNNEYSLFRIGAKTAGFWWTAGADRLYGWRQVTVSASHSLFANDNDAAILDSYIHYYENVGTSISANFLSTSRAARRHLDNMYVLNNAALTNLRLEFVNYYRNAGVAFDTKIGPQFLRISGILNGVNTFQVQKIMLFFDSITPLFLDNADPYEIGCSGSDDKPVRCFYQAGLPLGQRACGVGTCTNMIFRPVILIHFTTSNIAVSNAQEVQVLIPMVLANSATHPSINIPVAITSVHTGSFSSYNQLVEYATYPTVVPPTIPPAAVFSTYQETAVNVQAITSTKPHIFLVDTEIKAKIGNKFSSKFRIDCVSAVDPVCDIQNINEYYSYTLCGDWNFMENSDFAISNSAELFNVPEIYKAGVKNIRYQYVDAGLVTRTKYCFWFPVFTKGQVSQSREFVNMKVPDYFTQFWPPNTVGIVSGRSSTYGLHRYALYTDVNVKSFEENSIRNVRISPSVWYKNFKSMKITLTFSTSNKIYAGGKILMRGLLPLPITFIYSPNPFCFLSFKASPLVRYTCSSLMSSGTQMDITVATEMAAGDIVLEIYGVNVNPLPPNVYSTYQLITTTPVGSTATHQVDKSSDEAIYVQFENHPSGSINVPDISFAETADSDRKALSTLSVTANIGNSKNLFLNDILKLTFDATPAIASYDSTNLLFFCSITNNKNQILTSFSTCAAQTPTSLNTGLLITTETESGTSIFNIKLDFFDLIDGVPNYQLEVLSINGVATSVATQTMAAPKDFALISPIPNLGSASLVKRYNFVGSRPEFEFTISSSVTAINFDSRLLIKFPRDYDSTMLDNMHACVITIGAGTPTPILCYMFESSTLEITGFPSTINPLTAFKVLMVGSVQPPIMGPNEHYYFKLIDSEGLLKESLTISIAAPALLSTAPGLQLITMQDLTFSSLFIRSTTIMRFSFIAQNPIATTSLIYIFLDQFNYEYFSLPTTAIPCRLQNAALADIASGTCERIGKRILIKTGSPIPANTKTWVEFSSLITSNYYSCDIKHFSMLIANSPALTISDYAPAEYSNAKVYSAELDPALTYLNFEGLSEFSFIRVKRGFYNRLNVVRMDGLRFNDQVQFSLVNNFNNQFDTINPQDVEKRDSYFGEKGIPMLLGTSKSTILSIFLIAVQKTEQFKLGRFAPLPVLIIITTREKIRLPVQNKLTIYRGYESLAMFLNLVEIPQSDLVITLNVRTFDTTNLLVLKSASTVTLNKNALNTEIVVSYNKPITSEPVSITNSILELIVPADASYMNTSVDLEVIDLIVDTSTKFAINIVEITPYTIFVDIKIHMPLTIYYYLVPRYLYAELTAEYIDSRLKLGFNTDGYIIYGKMNVERSLSNFDITNDQLLADTTYIIRAIYKTFNVQTPSGPAPPPVTGPATLWNPLKRPDFTPTSLSDANSTVNRIDFGSDWKTFTTAKNEAGYGYIDFTFDSTLSLQNKIDICCYFGQSLSYPLENIWTQDSVRCPSSILPAAINYFQGIGFVSRMRMLSEAPTAEAQENRQLQTASNTLRVYLMRNLRKSQNTAGWKGLYSLVYAPSFEPNLYAQYSALPTIQKRAPLLEIEPTFNAIEAFAKFTIQDDGKSGNLTGIKLKSAGIVQSIVLEKENGLDASMTYQHIKDGRNPLVGGKPPVKVYKQQYASINDEFSLLLPNMTLDRTYALYYYGVTNDPHLLPPFTSIYKIEFIIRGKIRRSSIGHIANGLLVLFGLLSAALLL